MNPEIKKFLYVADRDLSEMGGVERYSLNFIKYSKVLSQLGFRVSILLRGGKDVVSDGECHIQTFMPGTLKLNNFFRFLNPLLALVNLYKGMKALLRTESPDVVLCRDFGPVVVCKFILKKRSKVIFMPGSLLKMDLEMDSIYGKGGLLYSLSRALQLKGLQGLEMLALRVADMTTVSTEFFKNNIFALYRIKPGLLHKLPVGIDLSPFVDREQNLCQGEPFEVTGLSGKKVILSVSRIVKSKNIFRILDILPLLPEEFVWVVIGGGPELAELRGRIEANGLSDRFFALGPKDNVAPFYASCNVFVHLSFYENFGQVLLEAMASGKPPIVLRPDGNTVKTATSEIIDEGVNGFFVQDDPNEIAKSIVNVDRLDAEEISRRCIDNVVEIYSFESHLKKLATLSQSS